MGLEVSTEAVPEPTLDSSIFSFNRYLGVWPTLYPSMKTAVTVDVLEAGLILAFVILACCFYVVLPGIRGSEVCIAYGFVNENMKWSSSIVSHSHYFLADSCCWLHHSVETELNAKRSCGMYFEFGIFQLSFINYRTVGIRSLIIFHVTAVAIGTWESMGCADCVYDIINDIINLCIKMSMTTLNKIKPGHAGHDHWKWVHDLRFHDH